jgi:hypothetical protein
LPTAHSVVNCCIKWLSMLSNNKSTNNTAAIITTWCLYCCTKVSLGLLLLVEVQWRCKEDNGGIFCLLLSLGSC